MSILKGEKPPLLLLSSITTILIYIFIYLYHSKPSKSKLNKWLFHVWFYLWVVIYDLNFNTIKYELPDLLVTVCVMILNFIIYSYVVRIILWACYKKKYLCTQLDSLPRKKNILQEPDYINYHNKISKLFKEDYYGRPPIHLATTTKMIEDLLKKGVDIDQENIYSGQTLLHLASRKGDLKMIEYLLQQGANINKKDIRKKNPLDYAKTDKIKNLLLQYLNTLKKPTKIKKTIEKKSFDKLIKPDISLWVQKNYIKFYFFLFSLYPLLLLLLYKSNSLINILWLLPILIIVTSVYVLIYLYHKKTTELTKWLIHLPFLIWMILCVLFHMNNKHQDITIDLIITSILTFLQVLILFRLKSFIVESLFLIKYFCIHFDNFPNKEDLLNNLLYTEHKTSDFFKLDKYGRPPIHLATDIEIVSTLLEKGADIEQENIYSGQTLLHLASRKGDLKMIEFLLEKGANINKQDMIDRTPMDYAKTDKIRNFLIANGGKETTLYNKIKRLFSKKNDLPYTF